MRSSGYLKIFLNPKGEFRTEASFVLLNHSFHNVDVKIDTGCPRTSLPIKRLGVSDYDAYKLKEKDCNNTDIAKRISFGVNDSLSKRNDDRKKFRQGQYMDLDCISFRHCVSDFILDGLNLGDIDVSVSYDRTGNILIGTDVLKKLETHIGEDSYGNLVLISSAVGKYTDEYLKTMENLFSLRKV